MAAWLDDPKYSDVEKFLELRVEALTQRVRELEAFNAELQTELILRRAEDAAMNKLITDCIQAIGRPPQ